MPSAIERRSQNRCHIYTFTKEKVVSLFFDGVHTSSSGTNDFLRLVEEYKTGPNQSIASSSPAGGAAVTHVTVEIPALCPDDAS